MAVQEIQFAVRKDQNILCVLLIAILVVSFLMSWVSQYSTAVALTFRTDLALKEPWRAITYLAAPTGGLLGVIFGGLWIWSIGSLVERDVKSVRLGVLLILFAVLAALTLWLGSMLTKIPGSLMGMWGLVTFLTVLWGTRYPNTVVHLMGVLPVKAKWIAIVSAGLVFFGSPPMLAPFAGIPLVLAYLFAKDLLPISYIGGSRKRSASTKTRSGISTSPEFLADVRKREQERDERERLRKLFETNMIDNEKDDSR